MAEAVEVILGLTDGGEVAYSLGPGEDFEISFEDISRVRVDVPERITEDGIEVADTTIEQEDDNGNREWTVDAVQCQQCGDRYPQSYTRCPECGQSNQKL